MGHSRTCTFQVNVNLSDGRCPVYGAMNLKEVRGIIASEQQYQNEKGGNVSVIDAEVWPQTKSGERYMKGHDYARMKQDFSLSYHFIS